MQFFQKALAVLALGFTCVSQAAVLSNTALVPREASLSNAAYSAGDASANNGVLVARNGKFPGCPPVTRKVTCTPEKLLGIIEIGVDIDWIIEIDIIVGTELSADIKLGSGSSNGAGWDLKDHKFKEETDIYVILWIQGQVFIDIGLGITLYIWIEFETKIEVETSVVIGTPVKNPSCSDPDTPLDLTIVII